MPTLVAIDPKTRFRDGAEPSGTGVSELLENARRAGYSHVRDHEPHIWHAIDAVIPGVDWMESHTALPNGCPVCTTWRVTWIDGPDHICCEPLAEWAKHQEPVVLVSDVWMLEMGLM